MNSGPKLSAIGTGPTKGAPSPLPVRFPVQPSYEELQQEVARLKAELKKKTDASSALLARTSVVDMYASLRPFSLLAPPSAMRPPHLSAVHESPRVTAFLEHLLKPIAVSESLVVRRGCGFSTRENGGVPVVVGDKEVSLFDVETAVRAVLELKDTFEVLRRGRPGEHVDAAVTAHSLEVVLHSVLMSRPWLHVAQHDSSLRYTTKCPTQGTLHELPLFFWEEEEAVVKRYQTTPGATYFWRVGDVCILALPSEHNGFNDDSDYKRARTMALMGFYTLQGLLGNPENIVVPFVTLNGAHVQLHVICQVPDESVPSVFSHPQWSWSVEQPARALSCLSCMYRLAEYLSRFGRSLTPECVAPLSRCQMKRLEYGFLTSKPVPESAVRVLVDHYGKLDAIIANGRHFMTSTGTWVKIYLSQEDGAIEARVLSELASLDFKAAPKLYNQWLLPHDCLAVEMEHCGQSLRKCETWAELAQRMHELAVILSDLHGKGWVHGDLKEGNLTVDASGALRLIDWEGAASAGQRPMMWTDTYRAPETLYMEYSPKSDIFSCGVILERWLGRLPDCEDESVALFWSRLKRDMLAEELEERLDAATLLARITASLAK